MTNLAILLGGFFGIYLLVLQRLDGKKMLPRRYVHQVIRDCTGAVGIAVIAGSIAGCAARYGQTELPLVTLLVLGGIPLFSGAWVLTCFFVYMLSTFFLAEKKLISYPSNKVGCTLLFMIASTAAAALYVGV